MSVDCHPFQTYALASPSHPYQASLASSASSSSSSVFSIDASSQLSQTSSSTRSVASDISSSTWLNEHAEWKVPVYTQHREAAKPACLPLRTCIAPVAPEQRQHPRRRSVSGNPPPTLVRQSDRKGQFVDCLVDSATRMVEVIWPLSVPHCPGESKGVLPLRTFIQETLRRSRTSFSTLQVALYYLILIKMHVPACDFTMEQQEDAASFRALQCGRRMFLSALILASKYLQDRNYSARAWSKISGLKVQEINTNEMAFLRAVSWQLHIKEGTFEKWQDIILQYTPQYPTTSPSSWAEWKVLVQRLTPDLEGVNVLSARSARVLRKAQTWPVQQPCSPATPTCNTPTPLSVKPLLLTSNESTPTPLSAINLPRYLEPRPDLRPPTPVRLGPLPTPSMTPQSALSSSAVSTPAASAFPAAGSRRSSMCAALQAAQSCLTSNMSSRWANCPFTGRVPALSSNGAVSVTSMNSSPESMWSDAGSRSSRASSISSISSAGLPTLIHNPTRLKLGRVATLRCARSNICNEPEIVDPESSLEDGRFSEPISSPDFQGLNISEADTRSEATATTATPSPQMAMLSRESSNSSMASNGSRKRGRSSSEFCTLQQHVREILVPGVRAVSKGVRSHWPVAHMTPDLKTPLGELAYRLPRSELESSRREIVVGECDRRKRLCQQEAGPHEELERAYQGPGMWTGLL